MRSITLGRIASVLTLAHPNYFISFGLEYIRRKAGSFM